MLLTESKDNSDDFPYAIFLHDQKMLLQKQLEEAESIYNANLPIEELKFLKPIKTKIRLLRSTLQIVDYLCEYHDTMQKLSSQINNEKQKLYKAVDTLEALCTYRNSLTEKLLGYREREGN
jgi:hypothetical protein